MKENIAYTVRPCRACGRPLYGPRACITPAHVPLCGTCIAWAKLVIALHDLDVSGDPYAFPLGRMEQVVRVLVRGAEREGMAYRIMAGHLAQFVAAFLAEQEAKPSSFQ